MSTQSPAVAIAQPQRGRFPNLLMRRVGSFIVTLAVTFVGLTAVTFFISRLTKIDPDLAVVGDNATKGAYDAAFKALGRDQPVYIQYLIYLRRLLTGDFGVSVLTSRPVLEDKLRVFTATYALSTITIIINIANNKPAGVVAAARKGRW